MNKTATDTTQLMYLYKSVSTVQYYSFFLKLRNFYGRLSISMTYAHVYNLSLEPSSCSLSPIHKQKQMKLSSKVK